MRLGIAGSGGIARETLATLRSVRGVEAAALCARPGSREAAAALAREYGVGSLYTDYDEMLGRPDLDFVYVGVVNGAHFDYARRALGAGKGVIVEKPFTATLAEAEALAAMARASGLFLFEAITTMHSPVFRSVLEAAPSIGKLRLVQCNFSQRSSRYDRYLSGETPPVFDPALSGGALYDLNVYNLHFAVALLGRPESVRYAANRGRNGVDTSGAALLRRGGALAVCTAAKDSDSPGFAIAQGEDGWLRVDGAPNSFESASVSARGGEPVAFRAEPGKPRMAYEWEAFERMSREGGLTECYRYLDHSLDVMDALERARLSSELLEPLGPGDALQP